MPVRIDLQEVCYNCPTPRLEVEEEHIMGRMTGWAGETKMLTQSIVRCGFACVCKHLSACEADKEENDER